MAKKKTDEKEDPFTKAMLVELRKTSSASNILGNTSIYDIPEWIDTGILALNMIISNSFTRGIPSNRFTQLYGASQTGKSLLLSMIGANAQKMGYEPVLGESEFGETKQSLVRKGFDEDKLFVVPMKHVSQWRTMMGGMLAIKEKYPKKKLFPMLDSLGNLGTEYEQKKQDEGKQDMGQRPKDIKGIFRRYMIDFGLAGIPFVFTNHVFENQAQETQDVTGGHGVKFMPTITLSFSKGRMITKGEGAEKQVLGTILHVSTFKNRISPPYRKVDLALDFNSGFKKYTGLLPVAIQHNLFYMEKGRVCIPHLPQVEKKGDDGKKKMVDVSYWESEILDGEIGDKVWTPILPKLEELVLKHNSFYSPEVEAEAESEREKLKKDNKEPLNDENLEEVPGAN